MKKNTTKTIKSPAPAKNPAPAFAPAPAPAPNPAITVKPVAKKKPVLPTPAPAVTAVATTPVTTKITAQIDIGFGNALYIRGEGPGLSWDKGTLMNCVADDQWQIVLDESTRPIVFKFLVNDLSWSTGEDYSVDPGTSVSLHPAF